MEKFLKVCKIVQGFILGEKNEKSRVKRKYTRRRKKTK